MLDKIFDGKNIIHKALDATWMRNQVIAENIANVDVPIKVKQYSLKNLYNKKQVKMIKNSD